MKTWRNGQVIDPVQLRAQAVASIRPCQSIAVTLREFWDRAEGLHEMVDRLMLLQEFADRHVYTKLTWRYGNTRRFKVRRGLAVQCWACRVNAAHCRHHIIQVQHGGPNKVTNCICLCRGCHAVVHPWLRPKDRRE